MEKRMVLLAAVTVSGSLVSAFAGDGTMKSWADLAVQELKTGTSIAEAVDYGTAANWVNETVGGGKESTVTLPETLFNKTRADGLRFVRATASLKVGSLAAVRSTSDWYAMMTNRVCFVSDEGLDISHDVVDGATADAHKSLPFHGRLYADVTSGDVKDVWTDGHLELCGDCRLSVAASQLSVGQSVRHRLDLYAADANPVRRNPMQVSQIYRTGAYIIYAPVGADEQVGQWSQTAGSPYLSRTGAAHALAAGTIVTGTGIPEGTFLKRVFTDGSIELSRPVTTTVTDNAVTFAAFTPDVYQYFGYASRSTKSVENFGLVKFRPQDKLRVEVNNLANFRALTLVHTDERVNPYGGKMYPGTLVIHQAHAVTEPVRLGDCHLEFADNGYNHAVHPNGFENATLMSWNPECVARLTVTNNLSAVCQMSNVTSTVVKDGLGTLTAGFNADLASNTGALVVEEGLFVATSGVADAQLTVGTLAISNGATFRLPPQGMVCRQLVVEPGAVLAGPGVLKVEGVSFADYLAGQVKGLVCTDGASVVYSSPSSSVNDGLAEPAVVGEPAFWVDASQAASLTYAADPDGTLRVSRLDDSRGSGYPYATSEGTLSPELVTNENGQAQHIFFERVADTALASQSHTLVWNETIQNICVIFKVVAAREGGGQVLGGEPFRRGAGASYTADLFSSTVGSRHPELDDATVLVNGIQRPHSRGYAYPGGDDATPASKLVPMVLEVHAAERVAKCASNGFEAEFGNNVGQNGDQRLYECLVYTNMLTEAESVRIRSYLMQKWLNLECDAPRVSDSRIVAEAVALADDVQVALDEGTSALIGSLSGSGTVTKSGTGSLYIDDLNDGRTSLSVESGSATLRSIGLAETELPTGAVLHVDISDAASRRIVDYGSRSRVSEWRDTRGAGYPVLKPHNAAKNKWPGYDNLSTFTPVKVNDQCLCHFGDSANVADNDVTALDFQDGAGNRLSFAGVQSVFGLYAGVGKSVAAVKPLGATSGHHLREDGVNYGLRCDARIVAGGASAGQCDLPSTRGKINGGEYVTGGTYVRLDGTEVNPYARGYNVSSNVLSFVSCEKFTTDAIGPVLPVDADKYSEGGFAVGEILLYQRALSPANARKVEAYLLRKWYNRALPGYRGVVMDKLSVAAGATVNVSGQAPIVANAVSGAGTVNGSVRLTADAVLEVPVDANGALAAVSVTGTIDLSQGGTVRILDGGVKLAVGRYVLVPAAKLASVPDLASWAVVQEDAKGRRAVNLAIDDGALVADVTAPGLTLIFR